MAGAAGDGASGVNAGAGANGAAGLTAATEAPRRPEGPVARAGRVDLIDVLRGFALLGIFVPNILFFARPMDSATWEVDLADTAINRWSMNVHEWFFLGKMMFLFATLFGAGALLFGKKYESGGHAAGAARWYIRCAWLLVFGVMHGILLWFGDILVTYAVCGMGLIWWLRRLPAWALLAIGVPVYLVGSGVFSAMGLLMEAFAQSPEGGEAGFGSLTIEDQVRAYTGSYLDALAARAPMTMFSWIFIPLAVGWWGTGLMLIGMALAKLGVYTGRLSVRGYAVLLVYAAAVGAGGTGLLWSSTRGAIMAAEAAAAAGVAVPPVSPAAYTLWSAWAQAAGAGVSLAYAAGLALLLKMGVARWLTGTLAAVGRMAFTNYISQTLLASAIFYGYGLGYFGKLEYPALWGVVALVWAWNIAFSLLWQRYFVIGPLEWAWRSLTYWRRQPMRRRAVADGAAGGAAAA